MPLTEEHSEEIWNKHYEDLLEFLNLYGDTHVSSTDVIPRYRTLGNWCCQQRAKYKQSTLSKERQERLEAVNFCWDPKQAELEAQWNKSYRQLKEYYQIHGHSCVPQKDAKFGTLASWVAKTRVSARKKGLSEDQVARLNQLDFVWELKKARFETQWNDMFKELQQYKTNHGDCLVNTSADTKLSRWVGTQRKYYKRKKMRPDRLRRLEALDFDWIVNPNRCWKADRDTSRDDELWQNFYDQLLEFYDKHGHSNVPISFSEGKMQPLGQWISKQRLAKTENRMREDRERLLKAVKFAFRVDCADQEKSTKQTQWEKSFSKLRAFKRRFGHCWVPREFPEDPQLARWVDHQKLRKREGNLAQTREEKLNSIDFFSFSGQKRRVEGWESKFNDLKQYQKQNDTTLVRSDENLPLYSWCVIQRRKHRDGNLSAGRLEQLQSIAFEWEDRGEEIHRPRKRTINSSRATVAAKKKTRRIRESP